MNQHQLINHIRKLGSTGVIPDALIPYFDQHGVWRWEASSWQQQIPKTLAAVMKSIHLPASRRTAHTRLGPVLMTSLIADREESVTIKYIEIRGSLIIHCNKTVSALGLRHISGHFTAKTTRRIDFPNLIAVDGNFEAASTFQLHAPRLRRVGGRMNITGNLPPILESVGRSLSTFWTFKFNPQCLRHVGGALIPNKAEVIDAPVLETIGGALLASDTTVKITTPALKSIGSDFLASHASDIRAPRLRTIGGDMDTCSATQFYHPHIRVSGDWKCNPEAIHNWYVRERIRKALRHHCEMPEL